MHPTDAIPRSSLRTAEQLTENYEEILRRYECNYAGKAGALEALCCEAIARMRHLEAQVPDPVVLPFARRSSRKRRGF